MTPQPKLQKDNRVLRDLVDRLCRKKVLSAGDEQLLRYLAEHATDPPKQAQKSLSERAIAGAVYKIRTWTTKNTTVRVAMGRLRESVDQYFNKTTEGRSETNRLDLPKRVTPYMLKLVPNKLQLTPVEAFWDAHFIDRPLDAPITIVYTEPLFFWNKSDRSFVRFLDINYEALDRAELTQKIRREHPDHPVLKLQMEPSYHYEPGGEIEARHTISDCLRETETNRRHARPIHMKVSRETTKDFVSESLVVLGNKRTNWLFKMLQDGHRITVEDAAITIEGKSPRPDEPPYAYSVLTRGRNRDDKSAVTLIGANHGRAAEKVAEFVSNSELLQTLYTDVDEIKPNEPFPATFQILFRVRVLEFDNPRDIKPILWWGQTCVELRQAN